MARGEAIIVINDQYNYAILPVGLFFFTLSCDSVVGTQVIYLLLFFNI